MPPRLELLDHLDHRAHVRLVRGARHLLGGLEAHCRRVLLEGGDVAVGVLPQGHAGSGRGGDGLVVDIRVVDDLPDLVPFLVAESPTEHVEAHEGAEVPDVAACVDGQSAVVHPHGAAVGGHERFFGTRERVVEAHKSG
jgi:hypothetical protein